MSSMRKWDNQDWVEELEEKQARWVIAIGSTIVNLNGFTAALLPLILITSIIYRYLLPDIIPNPILRGLAALISGSVVEFFAIAVMMLEQWVNDYNRTRSEEEAEITYNARAAKRNYLVLILLILTFGHVIPSFFPEFGTHLISVTVLFLGFIAWFSYELFSVNYTLRVKLKERKRRLADQALAESVQAFAEKSSMQTELELTKAETERLKAEARTLRAKAKLNESIAGDASHTPEKPSPAEPEAVSEVHSLYERGISKTQIAATLGISRKKVDRVLGGTNGTHQ